MCPTPTIVWFRHDLRLDDHPALHAAVASGGPIIPVYIWAPQEEGDWAPGDASCWWLRQSLASVADAEVQQSLAELPTRRHPSWDRRWPTCRKDAAAAR